jgi:hypothetical protein
LNDISDRVLVNCDLLRSALTYIIQTKQSSKQPIEQQPTTIEFEQFNLNSLYFRSCPSDIELMMSNCSNMSTTDFCHLRDAAIQLLQLLPNQYTLPIQQIVSFMCRINSNSHALAMNEYESIQFGFGLFPLCSIFNHVNKQHINKNKNQQMSNVSIHC